MIEDCSNRNFNYDFPFLFKILPYMYLDIPFRNVDNYRSTVFVENVNF